MVAAPDPVVAPPEGAVIRRLQDWACALVLVVVLTAVCLLLTGRLPAR